MVHDENPVSLATRMQSHLSPNAVVELWERAVENSPNNPNAHFGLGRCYNMQDRYADAEKCLLKAINGNPSNPIFKLIKLRNSNDYENDFDPFPSLNDIIQQFPDNGILRHEAASHYVKAKDTKQALKVLQPLLNKKADTQGWTICKLKYANILKSIAKEDEAEQQLILILEHNQGYTPALNALMDLSCNASRKQKLRLLLERIWERDKSSFDNFIRLYRFYNLYDLPDEAEKLRTDFRKQSVYSKSPAPSLSNLISKLPSQKLPTYFNRGIWRCWRLTDFTEKKWKKWSADIAWRQTVRHLSWNYFAVFGTEIPALRGVVHPPNIYGSIKMSSDGKAAIIAGNHQPPPSISTRYLENNFPTFSSLTFSPFNLICQEERYFGISDHNTPNIKRLFEMLDQGGVLGISPDTPTLDNTDYIEFLSGEIRLSTLIPRLAYKRAIPSYTLLPYWQEGQYGFDLIALPMPKPAESRNSYIQRWCKAYLAEYEKPLKSSGRLINAQSAAWSTMRFPDQSVL